MPGDTREEWLRDAIRLARPHFEELTGLALPETVRVGVGDNGPRVEAFCVLAPAMSDGVTELVFSIRGEYGRAPWRVLGALLHELIHAAGIVSHYRDFAAAARALGLAGKPSQAGWDSDEPAEVPTWARDVLDRLGPWPAGHLVPERGGRVVVDGGAGTGGEKQGSRMLRKQCGACGLIMRLSRKWHEAATRCPADGCPGALR